MSQLNKKSAIIETFAEAALNHGKQMTAIEKSDYASAMELVKELASNPNPNNLYELNQIIAYTVDAVIDVRMDYMSKIAEVKNTAFDERPKFKIKTQNAQGFWQAVGATPQKTKIGYKYDSLKIDALSARPITEWAEVAAGRYDFAELTRDITNDFEVKVAQKVQNTLYATFSGLSSPNYASGAGVTATFDTLLNSMMRLGGAAIIGDYEALQKLPALTAISGRTSNEIINDLNRNGIIGTYKGAPVVSLTNPYTGLSGFNTVLDRGYIYIVPAVSDMNKTLKIQFAGGVQSMQGQNIEDGSYEMRFDKHMGAGVIAGTRHALAVYEDTTL
ncbi:hypothetical protein [Paenibacillus cremeus]|uniref:Phage major capsid protein n=1 Tax=Paenibacillus cremeus TaxID=2163881 RepID=A0A559KCX7_9BACL|nr:hypothetical protein [Paenibacillus cremeus]TVY09964.1 hypothetical protein FPZ49_11375 [Paenibacillus cremeus]